MLAIPDETETLVRLLARRTGKSPETVIRDAVLASARAIGVTAYETDSTDRGAMFDAANVIAIKSASRPLLDTRSEDEILGYDDHGIPR
jgi:antitoxin VapB